jgi:hypothetical protein
MLPMWIGRAQDPGKLIMAVLEDELIIRIVVNPEQRVVHVRNAELVIILLS